MLSWTRSLNTLEAHPSWTLSPWLGSHYTFPFCSHWWQMEFGADLLPRLLQSKDPRLRAHISFFSACCNRLKVMVSTWFLLKYILFDARPLDSNTSFLGFQPCLLFCTYGLVSWARARNSTDFIWGLLRYEGRLSLFPYFPIRFLTHSQSVQCVPLRVLTVPCLSPNLLPMEVVLFIHYNHYSKTTQVKPLQKEMMKVNFKSRNILFLWLWLCDRIIYRGMSFLVFFLYFLYPFDLSKLNRPLAISHLRDLFCRMI